MRAPGMDARRGPRPGARALGALLAAGDFALLFGALCMLAAFACTLAHFFRDAALDDTSLNGMVFGCAVIGACLSMAVAAAASGLWTLSWIFRGPEGADPRGPSMLAGAACAWLAVVLPFLLMQALGTAVYAPGLTLAVSLSFVAPLAASAVLALRNLRR